MPQRGLRWVTFRVKLRPFYNTYGEMTSQTLPSRYDRHFVGIARYTEKGSPHSITERRVTELIPVSAVSLRVT